MIEEMISDIELLIVPDQLKQQLLKQRNEYSHLFKLKFISLSEFLKRVTYTYQQQAIYYVMKTYSVKYQVAKTYIENTYYIEDKIYQHSKLNFLVKLKKELKEQDLLLIDSFFQTYVKNHKVGILGYPFLDRYEQKILNDYFVKTICYKVKSIENKIPYYECVTMEEEIDLIANLILELYESGVPFHQIKLVNGKKEYYHTIQKIFAFYHLPISLPSEEMIYGTRISHFVLDHLSLSKEDLWNQLENKFSLQIPEMASLVHQILSVLNHYSWCEDLEDVRELIEEELKETRIKKPKLLDGIEMVSLSQYQFQNFEYAFLVGCNQGVLPELFKDEDFITDNMKKEIVLSNTVEKNQIAFQKSKYMIEQIPNLVITSKKRTPFEEYIPSTLLQVLNLEKKEIPILHRIHYSKLYDEIKLAKYLDEFYKYGTISKELSLYLSNYPQISYQTYENQFTGIQKEQLFHRMSSPFTISYTALDSYHRCPFRYYVNRILKCDPYKETFAMFIGNLFHDLLSKAFLPDFDLETEWANYLYSHPRAFTYKEQFFLNHLKEELKFDICTIKEQNQIIGYVDQLYEEHISISFSKELPVLFQGVLDKVYYQKKEDKTYVAIIDYKTGTLSTDLNQTLYGINMQLPIYQYLISHHPTMKNQMITGFYLQKILNDPFLFNDKETYEEGRKKRLRFVGYSTMNHSQLRAFDPGYENSNLIKGMKVGKTGFYSTAKVMSEEKLDRLNQLVFQKINEGIENILKGKFPIEPKVIGLNNVGCENCPYLDLCYRNERDKVYLKEYKNLEFLEEEK